MIGLSTWERLEVELRLGRPLAEFDELLATKFGGPCYEFRLADGSPLFVQARRGEPPLTHFHRFSLQIDELRSCICLVRGCGHVATRRELRDLRALARERARTKPREEP